MDSQTRRERRKQAALRNAERDLKTLFEKIDRRFDARDAAEAKQEEAPEPPERPSEDGLAQRERRASEVDTKRPRETS